MHLDLIHGLFITYTQLRLSITFIPAIIIMHIYNWYHLDITGIHYVHEYVTVNFSVIPLFSASHFPIPFCSPFASLYLLGTLLAVTGSVHLVPRLHETDLPVSLPSPIYPSFQNPDPLGFPRPKHTFTKMTSQIWVTRSSTFPSRCRHYLLFTTWCS
jgi:hypothetical protein